MKSIKDFVAFGSRQKRVVIINKYGPRHPSATGFPIRKLADYLSAEGIDVTAVSIHAAYKGKVSVKGEDLPYRTIELCSLYNGTNKLIRLAVNLIDGFRLMIRSMFLPRHDLKIVMTDPSLLNAWAVLFRSFYRSRLVFWTMDLYPDAFASAGLVSEGNWAYRLLAAFVYSHVPDFLIALGEQQYRYLCRQYGCDSIPHIILPCGIYECCPSEVPSWRMENQDKIIFCYAGNVGEAHNAAFLLELIKQLNPEKHLILLRLYGCKVGCLLGAAHMSKAVLILDYLPQSEMQYVDVNVASLLATWNHVCVPSKVVSAICAGTPVLYNANEESEGACMFPEAVWLLPDSPDQAIVVRQFLDHVSLEAISRKREAAQKYAGEMIGMERDSLQSLLDILKGEVR
ncbi:hypothetical protein [uncultured Parabacteroides sp.]|uniref:hypothetical protein n=1 Tax=uncultured Parabacteroides sp. TaxID=512312 RepID=UPI00259B6902|nr:hypothetical protein [uncultured Parabacteroides sp.]